MEKVSFKRMEVTGMSKEEALAKAPFNTNLPGADCTQALRNYKKAHVGQAFTDVDMKKFMLEQLEKKTRNTPGNGCYIVVESAVADTRERPYKISDVKNEEKSRKYGTIFTLTDESTGAVVAKTSAKYVQDTDKDGNPLTNEDGSPKMVWKYATKAQAKELAKKLYTEDGFKGNLVCTYTKQVIKGEPVAFTTTYTPSKSTRVGTYLVFGVEND